MNSRGNYLKALNNYLWDYALKDFPHAETLLDSNQRSEKRPPVFNKEAAGSNILMPSTATGEMKARIEATLPLKERHRHFASMKSSQALAQSIFGNLLVSGKLGLLRDLKSDENLPAFCDDLDTAQTQLEYEVKHLGEPRPTSVDFWIDGSQRIAVECKLTEPDFGTCSRPRLNQKRDKNYNRDYCDGTYHQQMGRESRCSLTEIGVKYWDYIPGLFQWTNDADQDPCPLRDTYQLVRNILATCVTADSKIDTNDAHVLVVYDARNPAFQDGGVAYIQWKATKSALSDPSLLRSCSWQNLIKHLSQSNDISWLTEKIKQKYGI